MRVDVRDDAARELSEARDFYDNETAGYGPLFVEAIERAFELVAEYPKVGKAIRGKARRLVLRGWPYSLVYMIRAETIVVVAIAHHDRRPYYWRDRLSP